MRALSLKQPWAWLVINGYKRVENRSWTPPRDAVGERIALHAGLRPDENRTSWDIARERGIEIPGVWGLPLGRIVGTVRIIGWLDTRKEPDVHPGLDAEAVDHALASPWWSGPVGIVLAEPRPLQQPIDYSGSLGLWRIPADIAERIEAEP